MHVARAVRERCKFARGETRARSVLLALAPSHNQPIFHYPLFWPSSPPAPLTTGRPCPRTTHHVLVAGSLIPAVINAVFPPRHPQSRVNPPP